MRVSRRADRPFTVAATAPLTVGGTPEADAVRARGIAAAQALRRREREEASWRALATGVVRYVLVASGRVARATLRTLGFVLREVGSLLLQV